MCLERERSMSSQDTLQDYTLPSNANSDILVGDSLVMATIARKRLKERHVVGS